VAATDLKRSWRFRSGHRDRLSDHGAQAL